MGEREIAPVAASRFAAIANGFYSARFVPIEERRWRIEDRGALQTLRFDHATLTAVDFTRSVGVIGERPSQGSLYVALDPTVAEPIVALTARDGPLAPAPADHPYLMESRWPITALQVGSEGALRAEVRGFGPLRMTWIVPTKGVWRVRVQQNRDTAWQQEATIGDNKRLSVNVGSDVTATETAVVLIDRIGD